MVEKNYKKEMESAFCANYDELLAKCLNQYIKDFPQTNALMIQGMKYYNDFLKNNETRR
jgi:hypothetical protein